MTTIWKRVIDEVVEAETHHAFLVGEPSVSAPTTGATNATIALAQERTGQRFPGDYRSLLETSDGWQNFDGEGVHLFGTQDYLGSVFQEALSICESHYGEVFSSLPQALLIGQDVHSFTFFVLNPDGSVLRLAAEQEQHPSLAEFLLSRKDRLSEEARQQGSEIANIAEEWQQGWREADNEQLAAELQALVPEPLPPPVAPQSLVEHGAKRVRPASLSVHNENDELEACVHQGLILYLSAAPTSEEIEAARSHFQRIYGNGAEMWEPDPYCFGWSRTNAAIQTRAYERYGLGLQHGEGLEMTALRIMRFPRMTHRERWTAYHFETQQDLRIAPMVEVLAPATEDPEKLAALCKALTDCLPVRCGQGGYLAAVHGSPIRAVDRWRHVFAWTQRHLALLLAHDGWAFRYQASDNEWAHRHWQGLARQRHCGAGWLTVLGKPFEAFLADKAPPAGVETHKCAHGTVWKAGNLDLGDIKRRQFPKEVAAVARLLHPVSMGATLYPKKLPSPFAFTTSAYLNRLVDPVAWLGPSDFDRGRDLVSRLAADMTPEQAREWGCDDVNQLTNPHRLAVALYNGSYHCRDSALALEALETAAQYPREAPPQTYNNLLIRYFDHGKIEEGLKLMPTALMTAALGNNAHTYHSAACLLVAAGKLDEAMDCVEKAVAASYEHTDQMLADDDLAALDLSKFR